MTVKRMPQEEPETKINNYNPVTGFTNKTQYDKTLQNFQQMSVLIPGCDVPWKDVAFHTQL